MNSKMTVLRNRYSEIMGEKVVSEMEDTAVILLDLLTGVALKTGSLTVGVAVEEYEARVKDILGEDFFEKMEMEGRKP